MNIENIALTDLKLDPSNSRSHDDKNIRSIARSLEEFGQQKPIVIDVNNVVIAGNGTVEAARGLGWSSIEAVRTELVGDHATAFAIADNRTAELAAWNEERLSEALEALREADIDHLTAGFTEEEIDALLSSSARSRPRGQRGRGDRSVNGGSRSRSGGFDESRGHLGHGRPQARLRGFYGR